MPISWTFSYPNLLEPGLGHFQVTCRSVKSLSESKSGTANTARILRGSMPRLKRVPERPKIKTYYAQWSTASKSWVLVNFATSLDPRPQMICRSSTINRANMMYRRTNSPGLSCTEMFM